MYLLMRMLHIIHRTVKWFGQLDLNGLLLAEVVRPFDAEDRVFQVVLAVLGLVRGYVLGELVLPVDGVDGALNFNDLDGR